jgi:rubrerythrin
MSQWVQNQDATAFVSPFVWTTLQPLVSLLESKHTAVQELGCFMVLAEVCNRSEISKMFMEGVVDLLKKFAADTTASSTMKKISRMALARLGIEVLVQHQPATEQSMNNLQEWLEMLGLASLHNVLEKHEISMDNVQYVTGDDLEKIGVALGPRKKLLNAVQSLNRHSQKEFRSHTAQHEPCLICFDGIKEMCFIPCGHVATCEQCAQITLARQDKCPICRTPVTQFVKPFYV